MSQYEWLSSGSSKTDTTVVGDTPQADISHPSATKRVRDLSLVPIHNHQQDQGGSTLWVSKAGHCAQNKVARPNVRHTG